MIPSLVWGLGQTRCRALSECELNSGLALANKRARGVKLLNVQDRDRKVSLTSFCTVLLFHESLKPGLIFLSRRNFGTTSMVKHQGDFLGGGEVLLKGFQEQIRETSVKKSLCGLACFRQKGRLNDLWGSLPALFWWLILEGMHLIGATFDLCQDATTLVVIEKQMHQQNITHKFCPDYLYCKMESWACLSEGGAFRVMLLSSLGSSVIAGCSNLCQRQKDVSSLYTDSSWYVLLMSPIYVQPCSSVQKDGWLASIPVQSLCTHC